MYFQYHRNLFHSRRRAGGFRILCLGDSLTFGAGVQPDETLPAQLELILNRASWASIVEVINEGVSGYSLHDDWQRFLERGVGLAPDLVVVVLCDNDAELFSVNQLPDKSVSYEDHAANCWNENGPHQPHFRLTLQEMAAFGKEHSLRFIVVFYMIYSSPLTRRIADTLAGLCREYGLDWLDLSADMHWRQDQQSTSLWRVSSEDGHPSALAHQVAAQRLARHIMAKGYLPKDLPPGASEAKLFQEIQDYSQRGLAVGGPPEAVLYRSQQILLAKHTSKARLKLDSGDRVDERTFEKTLKEMQAAQNFFVQVAFLEAYGESLERYQYQYFAQAEGLRAAMHQMGRKLTILRHALEDPSLWLYPLGQANRPGPGPEEFARAAERVQARLERLNALQRLARRGLVFSNGYLAAWCGRQNCRRDCALERINQIWEDLSGLCLAYLELHARLVRIFQARADGLKNDQWSAAFLDLAGEMAGTAASLEQLFDLLNLGRFPQSWPREGLTPFVEILVRAKSRHPDKFTLGVQSIAKVPQRPPVYDCRWVIRDGKEQTYRFRFPCFVMGQAVLIHPPEAGLEVRDLRMFLRQERMLTIPGERLQPTGAAGSLSTGLVLLPL